MHHLNRLGDVEAAPITTAESGGAGHLTHELPQADIAVLQLDLLHLAALALVASAAKHLHVDGADDGLGAGFGVANTGLAATTGHGIATGGDLLQAHQLGTDPTGAGLAELGGGHLTRLGQAVADQDATAVITKWRRTGGHIGSTRGEDGPVGKR